MLLFLILLVCCAQGAGTPIVLWHGLGDTCCDPRSIGRLQALIEAQLPGTYVVSLQVGGRSAAAQRSASFFMPAQAQVEEAVAQIQADERLRGGFYAVGFSQGGQFLRAYTQMYNSPPVRRLVTLGAQHQGVYGLPNCPGESSEVCEDVRQILELGAYSSLAQRHLAPANYWNDPKEQQAYLRGNVFLPRLNNQLGTKNATYVRNLQQLEFFTMVKFNEDTVVQPRSSEWFGFYEAGSDQVEAPLNQTDIWKQDLLGLKSVKLEFLNVTGNHLQFTDKWFVDVIIPRISA